MSERALAIHCARTRQWEPAIFSPCRTWRYRLTREWALSGTDLVVIGLNPSTADETNDDPTIRRCIRFAKDWGHARLHMVNLFAFRATKPEDMKAAADPVGPDTDRHLANLCREAQSYGGQILAAWGTHGSHRGRDAYVASLLEFRGQIRLLALGSNADGSPKHPLYIKASTRPTAWTMTAPATVELGP